MLKDAAVIVRYITYDAGAVGPCRHTVRLRMAQAPGRRDGGGANGRWIERELIACTFRSPPLAKIGPAVRTLAGRKSGGFLLTNCMGNAPRLSTPCTEAEFRGFPIDVPFW
jgi:hypothetical protein